MVAGLTPGKPIPISVKLRVPLVPRVIIETVMARQGYRVSILANKEEVVVGVAVEEEGEEEAERNEEEESEVLTTEEKEGVEEFEVLSPSSNPKTTVQKRRKLKAV
jgi:hypothetical protein